MIVLGIETTCDETAAAIVEDGFNILSNVVVSQIDTHRKFGGVFPEIASRMHIDNILLTVDKSIQDANLTKDDIDLISVASHPGLIGSILIGKNFAEALSLSLGKPCIEINHVEAHLYASMMTNPKQFPAIGLVISGGHTLLLKINGIGKYENIGSTVDDAIGEAFDKVATLLDLFYPGGPEIEKLAKEGDSSKYSFKKSCIKGKPFDFSFSGIKTQVLYTLKGQSSNRGSKNILEDGEKKHIAASFQKTVFDEIIAKALLAGKEHGCQSIYVGGGVSNNATLKEMFEEKKKGLSIFWPRPGLSLDNGAMIAGLAYHKISR